MAGNQETTDLLHLLPMVINALHRSKNSRMTCLQYLTAECLILFIGNDIFNSILNEVPEQLHAARFCSALCAITHSPAYICAGGKLDIARQGSDRIRSQSKSEHPPPKQPAAQIGEETLPAQTQSAPKPPRQELPSGDKPAANLAERPSGAAKNSLLPASNGSPSISEGRGSVLVSSPKQGGNPADEPVPVQHTSERRLQGDAADEAALIVDYSAAPQSQQALQVEASAAAAPQSSISTAQNISNKDADEGLLTEKALGISPERSGSQMLARQAAGEDPLSASPAQHAKAVQTRHELVDSKQKPEPTQENPSEDLAPSGGQNKSLWTKDGSKGSGRKTSPISPESGVGEEAKPSADSNSPATPVQAAEEEEETAKDSAASTSGMISTALTGNAHSRTKLKQDLDDSPAAKLLASALSGNSMQLDLPQDLTADSRIGLAKAGDSVSSPARTVQDTRNLKVDDKGSRGKVKEDIGKSSTD